MNALQFVLYCLRDGFHLTHVRVPVREHDGEVGRELSVAAAEVEDLFARHDER